MLFKGAFVAFDARKNVSPQRSGAYLPGPGAEVVLDGTIFQHDFAGTLDLVAGVIRGTGIVTALDATTAPKIINRSSLQPGAPTGVLTVRATGGFEQTAAGELVVTLANEGYSQLFCNGVLAKLGGTLRVVLVPGFSPAIDSTFPVVAAGSLEGTFASVELPDIGAGKKLAVEYTASTVQLRVIAN